MDRVPIFVGIVFIYFGVRVTNWIAGTAFLRSRSPSSLEANCCGIPHEPLQLFVP